MAARAWDVARHRDGVRLDVGADLVPLVAEALQLYELDSGSDQLQGLARRLAECSGTETLAP